MKSLLKHSLLLLFFSVGNYKAQIPVPQVFDDGVYLLEGKKKEVKPQYFLYNFKEFNDEVLYKKELVLIDLYLKYKKPPLILKNTSFYNPALKFRLIDSLIKKREFKLEALKYYLDPNSVKVNEQFVNVNTILPYNLLYQPFYILNTEVTNEEYKEFVYYVRDSIARTLLAYSGLPNEKEFGYKNDNGDLILNWAKKIPFDSNNEDVRSVLQPLYLPEGERFYNRPQIDTRKINYSFWLKKDTIQYVVNVYPDTLAWNHDFYSYITEYLLEPMANMYFWHPAYKDHPVVGLSCVQIKAFLFWKTQKLQRELDKSGNSLIVEYDLPNEVEIEMIKVLGIIEKMKKERMRPLWYLEGFGNYDIDLVLNNNSKMIFEKGNYSSSTSRSRLMQTFIQKYEALTHNGIYPTSSVLPPKTDNEVAMNYYRTLTNYGGLPFLNGNVSEWMSENFCAEDSTAFVSKTGANPKKWSNTLINYSKTFPYVGNYENAYNVYQKVKGTNKTFKNIKYQLIDSTKTLNDVCKLIKGSNWFDSADWMTGDTKKTFLQKDSTYSTLGFRYVVRFKEK